MTPSRVTERIRGGVAAFEPHLVWPQAVAVHPEPLVESDPAMRSGIELHHPALDAVGIELLVPARIERVRHVHALAVAAHLHHLRAPVDGSACIARVRR